MAKQLALLAGAHAKATQDELVRFPPAPARSSSMRSGPVSKKQRIVKSRNSRHGGGWRSCTDCRLARVGPTTPTRFRALPLAPRSSDQP
jgi:hypothetical protein